MIFAVHTLVFRSLKRTHDMFLYDQWAPLPTPEEVKETRKNYKKLSEYQHVKDMAAPIIVRKEKSVPLGPPTTG